MLVAVPFPPPMRCVCWTHSVTCFHIHPGWHAILVLNLLRLLSGCMLLDTAAPAFEHVLGPLLGQFKGWGRHSTAHNTG